MEPLSEVLLEADFRSGADCDFIDPGLLRFPLEESTLDENLEMSLSVADCGLSLAAECV